MPQSFTTIYGISSGIDWRWAFPVFIEIMRVAPSLACQKVCHRLWAYLKAMLLLILSLRKPSQLRRCHI